jgi:hypothetical protein
MTSYDCAIFTCAKVAKLFINNGFKDINSDICAKMIAEGLRKAHDKAVSENGEGKYLGHMCWSKDSIQLWKDNNFNIDKELIKLLRHEHVVPLKYFVHDILFQLPKSTSVKEIERKIGEFCQVTVITKSEDRHLSKNTMPVDWNSSDNCQNNIFARYVKAGIYKNLSFKGACK